METGKRQEEVYEYGSEGELLGVREDLEPGEKKEEAFNPRWRISILGAESTSEKIGKGEKYPAKTESEEEKEQRRAERTEKIESLKKEVEGSRKEYLEADYKKKKAYKRIWDFFGSLAKNNEEADWEQDQDLAYYRGVYDNNLFDLRNLLLEEAKEKGVSNKELGELLKVFTVEANMNLADVHDQVKIEHHEGKFSDFIRQHSMEMVQWYKNLPPHKKIAIAVAFSGAALGAGAIGGSIVGITASAITIRRAFMGMVTGTGVAMGLEAKARADRESKVADSHDKHAASIEGLNVDEKFEHLAAAIEKLIKDEDNKLQKIKNKNLRNLAIGTSVGTLVGSAGYWIGMLKETEAAKEIFGGIKGGLNSIAEKFGYQIGAPSAVPEMPKTSSVISEAGPKTPANIGLEVKSGGSLEGTIIEHLEQSGISAEEAGRKAHAMAVEYANEHGLENGPYSLVQPGAHIALSPDGSKISEISGRGLGYLPEKEIPTEIGHEAVPETAPEPAVPEEDIVPPTAAEAGNDMPDLEVPSNGTGEYVMDHETSDAINKMDLEIKSLSGQLGELDDKILKVSSGQYESVQIWPSPERMLEDLTAQKQVLEATKEEMITRIYAGHVGSLNKFLSGGDIEKWKEIKDMRAWDLLERRESIAHKFYDRILESNSKDMAGLKEHISPARGETVKDWILRVGKVMRKLGIKKNN
jgi:hypothetical protein